MTKDGTTKTTEIRAILDGIADMSHLPFLLEYVEIPPVAESRIALLYHFLCENGVEPERAHRYCVTTGLVQLGLDVHDTVKLSYDDHVVSERNRQLSVLAGDLYSSYYYHLLAESGDIDAIYMLAGAIQQINEWKMQLYVLEREDQLSWEKYLVLRKQIDTALYSAFVHQFEKDEGKRTFWISLLEETAGVERLIREWEQLQRPYVKTQQTPMGFARFLQNKYGFSFSHVMEWVERIALELIGACEQMLFNAYPPDKRDEFAWLASRYSHHANRLKRVAEEM